MLRGLKLYTDNLTAIVTVADDGGGSGILRSELNMPPPGDIRNCIEALANTEPTMEALLRYRFKSGTLKGQNLGNLFLAALNDMCSSFDEAVIKLSDVLAVTGRVLPVTNCNVILAALFDDGNEIVGESKISEYKLSAGGNIRKVRLMPENPPALKASTEALAEAEMIILGPGSLYTSIIPNLLTKGVSETIAESDAVRVYVLNVMTQEGETEGYTASDHIKALSDHAGVRLFDYCVADNSPFPDEIKKKYNSKGTDRTVTDEDKIKELGIELITAPVADYSKGLARHNPKTLAKTLMELFTNKSPTKIYS
ncbi:MAG: YvcK family protein [Oscillospiraceae bacterium]|nr:YvcK family protein [Oscillospiraceae bacterium]